MLYLDWAAGAPPDSDIWDESAEIARSSFANPSSPHIAGSVARRLIEEARERTATALGSRPDRVYFTSGATEANNLVISSLLYRSEPGSVIVSGIEHSSVYEPCRLLEQFGFRIKVIHPGSTGRLEPESVVSRIRPDTVLIAIMHVNNETGAIQPIQSIVKAIRASRITKRRIHVHSDLVQSTGRVHVDLAGLDIDSAVISGHKLGGPRGAGVLVLRNPIRSLARGGEQEGTVRPGTENLFAIWGACRAIEKATEDLSIPSGYGDRRAFFAAACSTIPDSIVIHDVEKSDSGGYSPFITALSFPPLPAEVLVRAMGDHGIMIGTGAACNSRKSRRPRENRITRSIGISDEIADSLVRFSWAPGVEMDDLNHAAATLKRVVAELHVGAKV